MPLSRYVCSCPDHSKRIVSGTSLYLMDSYTREWVNSGAGAQNFCKHIMASRRKNGDPLPEYTDVPIKGYSQVPKTTTSNLVGKKGDSFAFEPIRSIGSSR